MIDHTLSGVGQSGIEFSLRPGKTSDIQQILFSQGSGLISREPANFLIEKTMSKSYHFFYIKQKELNTSMKRRRRRDVVHVTPSVPNTSPGSAKGVLFLCASYHIGLVSTVVISIRSESCIDRFNGCYFNSF